MSRRTLVVLFALGLLVACGLALWVVLGDTAPTDARPTDVTSGSDPLHAGDPRSPTDGVGDGDTPEPPVPETRDVSVVVSDRGTRGPLKGREVEITVEYVGSDGERRADVIVRTTDSGGRVGLTIHHRPASITVRDGARAARWDSFRGGAPPDRLALDVAPYVPVEVVGAAGAAVSGVRVVLEYERPRTHPPRRTVAAGVSGADGRALLILPAHGADDIASAHVSLGIPLARSVSEPLDLGDVPDSPVRLVLPDIGRVEIAVFGPAGQPFLDRGGANLTAERTGPVGLGLPHWQSEPIRRGRVVFPFVGVGLRLEVRVQPDAQTLLGGVLRADGPARSGEVVRGDVRVGWPKPAFVGRLLDERRQPIAHGYVHAKLLTEHRSDLDRFASYPSAGTNADAEGRFRLEFDTDTPYAAPFVLELAGVAARFTYAEPITDSPISLGDVVLAEVPLLVAGSVVGPDGTPPASLALYVERRDPDGEWQHVRDVVGISDRERRFEIRGTAPAGDLRLRQEGPRFVHPEPIRFTRGQRDVVVRVVRSGGLRGSVTMPPGAKDVPVRVFAEGGIALPGDRWSPGRVAAQVVSENGEFQISGLHPGTGKVSVYVGGETEPVEVIENVAVRSGEITEDGRLRLIDIRGHLRTRTLTVSDAEGNTLTDATVWTRPAGTPVIGEGGWFWRERRADAGGRVVATIGTAPLHVLASARGHGFVEIPEVRDDTTLTLPRATRGRVRVRLADDVELPEPPLRYTVSLSWAGTRERVLDWLDGAADPRSRALQPQPFEPDRSATLGVPAPGRYRAHLTLWRDTVQGGAGFPVRAADLLGVIVDGGGEPAELVFRPDPESLADALAKHENRE